MEKILDVAQYIYDEYKRQSGEIIYEMKLHKLLYFTQRESLAITNEPLFAEKKCARIMRMMACIMKIKSLFLQKGHILQKCNTPVWRLGLMEIEPAFP